MMMTLSCIHTMDLNKNTTTMVTCHYRRYHRHYHRHRHLLLLHCLPHGVPYRMTLSDQRIEDLLLMMQQQHQCILVNIHDPNIEWGRQL